VQREFFGKETMNILDIIFPKRCPFCDGVIPPGWQICDDCTGKAELVTEPVCKRCGKPIENSRREYCGDCERKKHFYDAGKAVFVYQGAVQRSLYRFKYANRREYASFYGEMACIQYARWISTLGIEAVIPIPLHRKRRQERGYNQAELLADEIGRRMGIPVEKKLLLRCLNTRPQKELDDRERKKNLKKAFIITQNIVQLRKVLLVDDIYTTGSTVDAAAECLKKSGIQKVYVLCISIGRGH
jgi:ComF family protein